MNRLLQLLTGKTVAIVGNGNVNENYSEEIDNADVVVRFNHFYNYDSGNVGKKVDIIIQTVTQAWYDAPNKHLDVIRQQCPNIFIAKRPDLYTTTVHSTYGADIKIENISRLFEPWWHFTTGTAFLCYLAQNLKNAKVKCYGFQDEQNWINYIQTEASHYAATANEERIHMMSSIYRLSSLDITEEPIEIPNIIVIPIKANSSEVPEKNRKLIGKCIEKCLSTNYEIVVVGDDLDLLHEVSKKYSINTCALPSIGSYTDVTETLRNWKVKTGYCGNICLVQCTSPYLDAEWIKLCFDNLEYSPIVATSCFLNFKVNSIYRQENGVFVPVSTELPPPTVARQMLPNSVRITGAVTAFHSDALDLESIFQAGILRPLIIDESFSLDVDTIEDMEAVQSHDLS